MREGAEMSDRHKQAIPSRAELRRHWFELRRKADAGDTLALGLVIALAQGEGRRIATPERGAGAGVVLG